MLKIRTKTKSNQNLVVRLWRIIIKSWAGTLQKTLNPNRIKGFLLLNVSSPDSYRDEPALYLSFNF
jgi:hypothetical protein